MENRMKKLISCMAVFMMLAVATVPLIDNDAAGEIESSEPYGGFGPAVIYGEGQEYEFPILLALAIGFIVGVVITSAYDMLTDSSGPHTVQNEENVKEAVRQAEASKIKMVADNTKNMVSTILPADVDLWFFTTDYWQKTIEYVIAADWTKDAGGWTKYQYEVLEKVGLLQNASNYTYTWQAAMDEAYNALSKYSLNDIAASNYGDKMNFYVSLGNVGGNNIRMDMGTTPTADTKIVFDFTKLIEPVSGKTFVFLDSEHIGTGEDYDKSIYNFSSSNVSIVYYDYSQKDTQGNPYTHTYTLTPGINDITNLPTGYYSVPAGAKVGGPFSSIGGTTSAPINGILVVYQKAGNMYYLKPVGENVNVFDGAGNQKGTTNDMKVGMEYNLTERYESVIIGEDEREKKFNIPMLWNNLIQQIDKVTKATMSDGQATWEIFDACESSSDTVKPSSFVLSIPGVEQGSADYIAAYTMAMKEIADYYKENEKNIDNITLSKESIGLVCYGNIYYQGKEVARNVVFTPYIATENQELVADGTMIDWNGTGYAMVWAQVSNFNQWDRDTKVSEAAKISLDRGYSMEITKIAKKNAAGTYENLESISLTKAVIQKYNTGSNEGEATDDVNFKGLNGDILLLLVILELGIIIAMLGYFTGNQILIIIGAIVIVVSILWPHLVYSLMVGTFEVQDLLPFKWLM